MKMRGFSLIEAMVALGLAAVTGTLAVSAYQRALGQSGADGHEWTAFTLAQQRIEELAAVPRTSSRLNDRVGDMAEPGTDADANCSGGVDGTVGNTARVDGLGNADPNGMFELCWKVTRDHPSGTLKNVRVIATYPAGRGERASVMLQILR